VGSTIGSYFSLPRLGSVLEPVETPGPIKYIDLLESPNAGPSSNADTILNLHLS
jgi:hypothetical protein